MTAEDLNGWERIEPILDRALDLPTADRAAYLDRACGADRALRSRVERMLAAGEDPDGPLERSFAAMAGPLLADLEGSAGGALPVGEMIGPWRLTGELGHGGMGAVYRAERADGQFAQTAALKLVRQGGEHDPLLVRRFLEERRILATLTHPHIARLLDGGVTAAGLPWFAMEYVPGKPLDRYCDDRRLDVPARLALMEQVLAAVSYAHRNLLVHRDLKPGNIFVTDDGEVKLLDFGIAKLLAEETPGEPGLTLPYGRAMTPEYAAPEQVRGEPVTTATDIYALGAVLYQLLTGKRAHRFGKRTAVEIERVVCETDPEPPSQAGGLSADLDTLVLTALQKDPARRYGSAEAMLEDLRRYRTGRPLLARPDSFGYRSGKFIGRHRLGVGAGVLLALALIGGVVATAWQARVARQEAARAEQVKEFLIDLLHQADPNITLGREPTVRQLLDRGTARVDSLLAGEPAVQAELYEVLGNTYAHLNLLAQADTLHRKELAAVRRLYGAGNPEILNAAMAVAWGYIDQGEYRAADSLLSETIREYRAAGGGDSQALADALDILGTAKKRLEHPAEAESLYRQSLALQVRLTGPADTITASRLSDLGSLLAAQDRLLPAESALTAAQQHRRALLSPKDLRYVAGESNLASIQMKRGDFAEAEPRMAAAVAGMRDIEGPGGGLNGARTLDRMALLQSLELHLSAAIVTAQRAAAMFDTVMGSAHPETLKSLSALAGYQAEVGSLPDAVRDARAAYAGLIAKMGERHDWTLAAGLRLAAIELQSGGSREAGATVAALLPVVNGKYGRIPPALAELPSIDAALAGARGDSAGAERGFQAALAALSGGTRVDSAAYPRIVLRYAQFLQARGAAQAAAALARGVLGWLPAGADPATVVVAGLRRIAGP